MGAERLPWFPCYPSKLLGALAEMKPDQKLVYQIVLLRIYEVRGPCPDSLDAISTRCGINRRRVSDALDPLFKAGKLLRVASGITNQFADAVLSDQMGRRDLLVRAGRAGGFAASEKTKSNQRKTPSDAAPSLQLDTETVRETKKEDLSPTGERRARPDTKMPLPPNWQPTIADLDFASRHGFDRTRATELAAAFVDNHRAKGTRMVKWDAAWRMWVRNEITFSAQRRGVPRGPAPTRNGAAALALQFGDREEK